MSSSARKLRRKMNRALPGMSNEDAVLVMSALAGAEKRAKEDRAEKTLKAAKEVEEYFGGIFEAEIPVEDIVTEIRRECGFDIDKTFERIYAAWGNQKLEERENVE